MYSKIEFYALEVICHQGAAVAGGNGILAERGRGMRQVPAIASPRLTLHAREPDCMSFDFVSLVIQR
jgi:hypothetical protein